MLNAISHSLTACRANFPEDRFGFLAEQIKTLNSPYRGEKIDNILMLLEKDQKKVYLVKNPIASYGASDEIN